MLDTQQKIKQYKNVAVAIVRNEEGKVLLVKPTDMEISLEQELWDFPSNIIIPGSTYTETFASEVLEKTGCIIEAVSLISSEKIHSASLQYEFVECKIICKDSSFKNRYANHIKWVPAQKLREYFQKRINKDLLRYFGLMSDKI